MPEIFPALYLSLKVALIATAINLVLGTCAGYLLARKRFIGRELLDTILVLPMVLPPTVMGYYLLVLLGKQGSIGKMVKRQLRHQPDFYMARRGYCRRGGNVSADYQARPRRALKTSPPIWKKWPPCSAHRVAKSFLM